MLNLLLTFENSQWTPGREEKGCMVCIAEYVISLASVSEQGESNGGFYTKGRLWALLIVSIFKAHSPGTSIYTQY